MCVHTSIRQLGCILNNTVRHMKIAMSGGTVGPDCFQAYH